MDNLEGRLMREMGTEPVEGSYPDENLEEWDNFFVPHSEVIAVEREPVVIRKIPGVNAELLPEISDYGMIPLSTIEMLLKSGLAINIGSISPLDIDFLIKHWRVIYANEINPDDPTIFYSKRR